ncbi:uncharacterized protein EI97DRAFT_500116 [Westerdykella ornata]|uniref:Uncharacterized protein n=1 Tax=Westerdykella ornata TaxID=318751 RepID=A0A6A6JN03_WESOR|nr:uncharacterized protein EI97DRAFT_500116 [Westerdykella ornata]KAF2277882.1 hypothetical protein EI97DRAFT_500116 [Westerdykella ornata]
MSPRHRLRIRTVAISAWELLNALPLINKCPTTNLLPSRRRNALAARYFEAALSNVVKILRGYFLNFRARRVKSYRREGHLTSPSQLSSPKREPLPASAPPPPPPPPPHCFGGLLCATGASTRGDGQVIG